MNVVDSSAWLSYFAGDKNAEEFATATGNKFSAVVWTQDADFKALPNVKYVPKVKVT